MAKTVTLLCAWGCAALSLTDAATRSGDASPLFTAHQTNASGALLTLSTADTDADSVWIQYEEFVMSRARRNPLVLYFDGGSGAECDAAGDTHSDGNDEEDEIVQEPINLDATEKAQECRAALAQQNDQLLTAMDGVALANKRLGLQVVHVPDALMAQFSRYHRVTTRPSLLWLSPRSANGFQRYPHPETNALDLSAPEKLIEVFTTNPSQNKPTNPTSHISSPSSTTNPSLSPEQQLTAVISEFVRQWYAKSGLVSKSGALTNLSTQTDSQSDEIAIVDFVPVLGLLAFLGFVVYDNREVLQRTLEGRFVWFIWSLGVLFVAYSGVFHSVIHRMPMFYFSPHHGLYLFHPSGRRQFVLEGLLSGSWSFCVSLGAFSIVEIMPMERSRFARNEIFWYSMVIIGISYSILYVTFIGKNKWLNA